MYDVMIYVKKNMFFMRLNVYINVYEYMFVLFKGKLKIFNLLKEFIVRNGMEMFVINKGVDVKNNKILKEFKKEKIKNNIWYYVVGLGGSINDKIVFNYLVIFLE